MNYIFKNAINIDEQNNVWYYYYTDFKLVCMKSDDERDWDPHISGADFLSLQKIGEVLYLIPDMINTESMRNLIFIVMSKVMRWSSYFMKIKNFC